MADITLQGRQKEVLALDAHGHNVVLGTAGSGKTTLAVFRARYLSELFPQNRILLVTFNKSLISYLNAAYGKMPHNVTVENYHKFARGYLANIGEMSYSDILDNDNLKKKCISTAICITIEKVGDNSTLKRSVETFESEIKFIQEFGIESLETYEKVERIGRSSNNIKRENRKYFYWVYEQYKVERMRAGYKYDWNDLAYYTYQGLLNDMHPRMYSHILVDEGQDFSPMMLKSLIAAIPDEGSFIFFGDVAQQIYGSRLSWRDAGIKVANNEIWKFKYNFRNTAEIVSFASDITKSVYWHSNDDLVIPDKPRASGPLPQLIRFDDYKQELNWVVDSVKRVTIQATSVVVFRNYDLIRQFEKILKAHKLDYQLLDGNIDTFIITNGISIGTYHSVKGIEFDNVFLPMLNSDVIPDNVLLKNGERQEVLSDEMKLLYVAATRAKRSLIMSFSNELTELFPIDSKNYEESIGRDL